MRFVFIFCLLVCSIKLIGKEKPAPFIKRILSHRGSVLLINFQPTINDVPLLKIDDLPATFQFTGQGITKNAKGVFLNHIGTGRVYQWMGDAASGEWKRIDSTFFTGYHFLSFFFSVDSSLYSFGGVGFWQHNGQLRKYNFLAHEWKAKELNHSIPWIREPHEMFYVDTINKMLYFNGEGRFHDASLKENTVDSVTLGMLYALDIEKGLVKKLGKYDMDIAGFFGQTPWGTITTFNRLADFINNEYYSLSESVENNLYRILSKSNSNHYKWQYSFWLDSALYFTNSNFDYDSVIIHKNDLIKINQPLYIPVQPDDTKSKSSSSNEIWMMINVVFGLINVIVFLSYAKQRKKLPDSVNDQKDNRTEPAVHNRMKLSEIERELLQLIFEKSVLKKMTEIQDINTLLGCNNKNIDIQKRLRSDAINALNDKMSLLLLTDKKVIERKRSAFDGRSFEYYIDQQYFTAIQQLLNHSASA